MKKRWFTVLLSVLLILATGFMGCSMGEDDDSGPSILRDVDIVVVGAGVAGATAALSAVEGYPAVKVVLIDINPVVGGTMYRAGGGTTQTVYNMVDSDGNWDTTKRTSYSNSVYYTNPTSVYHGRVSGYPQWDLLGAIARHTKPTWDGTLANLGIGTGTGTSTGYAASPGSAGAALYNTAVENADHVEFLGECRATDLYYVNGVVSGVTVTYEGKDYIIKAKKTILAPGGFSKNNQLLLEKIIDTGAPNYSAETPYPDLVPNMSKMALYNQSTAANGADGNMLPAVERAGAAFFRNWSIHLQGLKYDDSLTVGANQAAFIQPRYATGPQLQMYAQILVNNEGKRFTTEGRGIAYGSAPGHSDGGRALYNEAKPPYYIIFNQDNPSIKTTVWGSTTTNAWTNDEAVNLTAALDAAAELGNGQVYKDATIAGLAAKMGVPEANLQQTVTTYNGYVTAAVGASPTDTSFDPAFNKQARYLTKQFIESGAGANGPFYAVKLYPESHISMGGPVIDAKCRVLTKEIYLTPTSTDADKAALEAVVIPNLYAVGEFANRAFYNVNYVGAVSLTMYPVMGRIAALHAVQAIVAP
jgi:succinate dehydrogenase/fumarate reductase flavoprotein subunit